jgi:hypothetical protein
LALLTAAEYPDGRSGQIDQSVFKVHELQYLFCQNSDTKMIGLSKMTVIQMISTSTWLEVTHFCNLHLKHLLLLWRIFNKIQ